MFRPAATPAVVRVPPSAAAREPDRLAAHSPCMESLEARTVCDAANPVPGDGNDYILLAGDADDTIDTIQPQAVPAQVPAQADGFQWIDGTWPQHLATRASDAVIASHGDGWEIWPRDQHGNSLTREHTDETNVRALARRIEQTTGILVIDIEDWPTDPQYTDRATVDASIAKFRQTLGWVRDEAPTLKVAIYGILTTSDQYASSGLEEARAKALLDPNGWWAANLPRYMNGYAKWQAYNEYLRPIAEMVDFVCPSLYLRTTDVEGLWTRFATAAIDDARRFGKPVIPFVMPAWHDSLPGIGHTLAPTQTWAYELDVIRAHADGVIAWDYWDYDANSDWANVFVAKAQADGQNYLSVQAAPPPLKLAATDDRDAWTKVNDGASALDRDDDGTVASLLDLIAA